MMRRSLSRQQLIQKSRVPVYGRLGAILSMELVLVLPIFMLILFSVIEFSLLSSARTRLTDAARNGARMLCISDRSPEDVKLQVRRMLGSQLSRDVRIDIQDSAHPGDIVNVSVSIPMANASPDLLWMTGFSVRDRFLSVDSPMAREHTIATRGMNRL